MTRQLILITSSLVALIVTLVFNYTATAGVLGTDQTTLSAKYQLEITPPGLTFGVIWPIIYLWQILWIVVTLVQTIMYGSQLDEAVLFGTVYYIAWIASCVFNGSWIVLFSFELLTIQAIALIGLVATLYIAIYKSTQYIGYASAITELKNSPTQSILNFSDTFPDYILNYTNIVLYRGLVLNGVSFYATWVSIATCLGIAIFLAFVVDIATNTASIIALLMLAVILLVYLTLDFYVLRSWLYWTYSPYFVLIFALSTILTNPKDGSTGLDGLTRVLVIVLLAVSAVSFVAKLVLAFFVPPKDIPLPVATRKGTDDSGYNVMNTL